MKHQKTFLAIFIIVLAIFAIAFWSNIQKVPTEYPQPTIIEQEVSPEPAPEPLGENVKG